MSEGVNRDHVKILLSKSHELEFFYNMQVGDEFFLSLLYSFKNSIKNFNVTYDDWDYIKNLQKDLKNDELFKYYDIFNTISKSP
jgi:hypothetical protein